MAKIFRSAKKTEFKFKYSEKTLCLTCSHVINKQRSILYVSHDSEDGTWQFLCGKDDHDSTNAKIVSLLNIVELDSTVNDLYEMPLGYGATRKNVGDKWKPFKK